MPKRRLLTLFLLLSAPSYLASCSSPYLRNRGRDAADIFTVEFSTHSYGASVRTGPLKLGASYKSHKGGAYGLRGGRMGKYNTAEFTALFFGADYFRLGAFPWEKPSPKVKTDSPPAMPGTTTIDLSDKSAPPAGSLPVPGKDLLQLRGKELHARSPFGTTIPLQDRKSLLKGKGSPDDFSPAYYYTEVEVNLGLFFGLKVGFNIGELFDFFAGWFRFDPLHDDAPYKKRVEGLESHPLWKELDEQTKERIRNYYNNPTQS